MRIPRRSQGASDRHHGERDGIGRLFRGRRSRSSIGRRRRGPGATGSRRAQRSTGPGRCAKSSGSGRCRRSRRRALRIGGRRSVLGRCRRDDGCARGYSASGGDGEAAPRRVEPDRGRAASRGKTAQCGRRERSRRIARSMRGRALRWRGGAVAAYGCRPARGAQRRRTDRRGVRAAVTDLGLIVGDPLHGERAGTVQGRDRSCTAWPVAQRPRGGSGRRSSSRVARRRGPGSDRREAWVPSRCHRRVTSAPPGADHMPERAITPRESPTAWAPRSGCRSAWASWTARRWVWASVPARSPGRAPPGS